MKLTRRNFFVIPFAMTMVLTTSCATVEEQTKISRLASDVVLIADALTNILPALTAVPGMDAGLITQVGGHIAKVRELADRIRAVNATAVARPIVEQVVENVQAVLSVLATVQAIPSDIRNILTAASIMIPVIQIAVNIIVPQAKSSNEVDDARRILEDAAK